MNYYLVGYKVGNFVSNTVLDGIENSNKITSKVINYIKDELTKLIRNEHENKTTTEKVLYAMQCGDISQVEILSITIIEDECE